VTVSKRLEAIFSHAMQLADAEERRKYIEQACLTVARRQAPPRARLEKPPCQNLQLPAPIPGSAFTRRLNCSVVRREKNVYPAPPILQLSTCISEDRDSVDQQRGRGCPANSPANRPNDPQHANPHNSAVKLLPAPETAKLRARENKLSQP
jgi:hypothetical protein